MDMKRIEERYISLLTDFGFKRIFGTKPNKDLLINFLNSLFDGFQVIKDVKYLNSEHVGDVFAERKAILMYIAKMSVVKKFMVEMQNAYQKYSRIVLCSILLFLSVNRLQRGLNGTSNLNMYIQLLC